MTNSEIISLIIKELEHSVSQKISAHTENSLPTSMKLYSLKVAELKRIIQILLPEINIMTPRKVVDFGKELIGLKIFEAERIAVDIVRSKKKWLFEMNHQDLKDYRTNLDNWASVDNYCSGILGIHWREKYIDDGYILRLSQSDNRWLRRCSIVSTIPLNMKARGGNGDIPRTIWICEKHIDDYDDMILKAISWALRSIIQHDKDEVRRFLDTHRDRLNNKIIREVTTKLETGLKNPNLKRC